jgi:conjugative transfer pilus assembly protein TraH
MTPHHQPHALTTLRRAAANTRRIAQRSVATALAAALLSAALPSRANGNWLESFFNESGAYANTTNGGAFHGQSMNVMTGGSLFMRVPQKNYQLYSFSPPSISAGCGGIDIFTGSFSFINKDQFVAMMRNIGQAAVGHAFLLALKSMAPEVAEVMQYLQRTAQEANGNTINACKEGEKLAGSLMGDYMNANARQAADWSLALNRYPDGAEAYRSTRGSRTEYQMGLDDAKQNLDGVKPRPGSNATPVITEGNVVWRALSMDLTGLTNDEKRMLMSISGTVVFDNQANAEPTMKVQLPVLTFKDVIGDEVAQIKLLNCVDGFTDNGCRQMTPVLETMKGFKGLVKERFDRISQAMRGRNSQLLTDVTFAGMISLPVQRILAAGTNVKSPNISAVLNQRIEEVAAAEYAANFVRSGIDVVIAAIGQAKANKTKIEVEELKTLEASLSIAKRETLEVLRTAYANGSNLANVTRELESLEQALQATLPAAVNRAIAFDRSQNK